MNKIRVKTGQETDLAGLYPWLDPPVNRAVARHKPSLERLLQDGCLLLAHGPSAGASSLQGMAGLDLSSGQVSLLACQRPQALPALLDAVERLAVSFGMQELRLQLNPLQKPSIRLPAQWRRLDEPGWFTRRLSRRLTRVARLALAMNSALGIPAGYGRKHRLKLQAEPEQLACIGEDVFGREQFMTPRAASALHTMTRQAGLEGVAIQPVSAFRSVEYQHKLIRNKLDKGQKIDEILKVSAAPGYSEHHSGRAIDLTTPGFKPLEEEFAESEAFTWLSGHASKFGFRLSYPRGNRHGVAYEPWHWYYLGRA